MWGKYSKILKKWLSIYSFILNLALYLWLIKEIFELKAYKFTFSWDRCLKEHSKNSLYNEPNLILIIFT